MRCYSIQNKRPHTNVVCYGDEVIGRVSAQTRGLRKADGKRRFWTATPEQGFEFGGGASIGTRYPTRMAAARALWLFHREATERGLNLGDWHEMNRALNAYRQRYGIVAGRLNLCDHVPA